MPQKRPPYQIIGWANAFFLVVAVGYFYQFHEGKVSTFWLGMMATSSFAVLLMFALDAWNLATDYQAGYLFPMRNATFFVVCGSVVVLPLLGLYGMVTGQTLQASTMLLIPVFLWMAVRNLFRVKIDKVALEAKIGFRAPIHVPLFEVVSVEETESGLLVKTKEGRDIRLFKAFFFTSIWTRLRERLASL